jgi:hypothetical protein
MPSALFSSLLLCGICTAMILSRRGIWTSYTSPLVVFPALYLLTPGISSLLYLMGIGADDMLMKPAEIPVVCLYASAIIATFYIGYIMADYVVSARTSQKNLRSQLRQGAGFESKIAVNSRLPALVGEISSSFLVAVSVLALAVTYQVLGWETLWHGSALRGEGQWDAKGVGDYIALVTLGLLMMSTIVAGVISAWFPRRRLWVAPLAWSLFMAPGESRAVVLPFALFVLAAAVAGKKIPLSRMALISLLTVVSVVYIGAVRSRHASLVDFAESLQSGGQTFTSTSDPINGLALLAPTTATFWVAKDIEDPGASGNLWRILSPVPSFLVEQHTAETNLMAYVGHIGGNQANPFPVLGEMYLYFGWAGVMLGFPAGFLLRVIFDRSRRARPDGYPYALLWPSLYTACVLAGITSLHSGLRTATRMPLWAVLYYLGFVAAKWFLRDPMTQNQGFRR